MHKTTEDHVSNHYLIKRLVPRLNDRLKGQKIKHCFSLNKNEIVISFDDFVLKAYFGDNSFVFIEEKELLPSSKHKPIFAEIINKEILECIATPQDRSFRIILDEGFSLAFMMYGRNGNVLLFNRNVQSELFRPQFEKHKKIEISYFNSFKDPGFEEFVHLSRTNNLSYAVSKLFKGFSTGMLAYLGGMKLEEINADLQWKQIQNFEQLLLSGTIDIIQNQFHDVYLTLLPDDKGQLIYSSADVIESLRNYAFRYFYLKQFNQLKAEKQTAIKTLLEKNNSHLESAKNHLEHLEKENDYKKQADIIMANLHQIDKDAEVVKLFDFYNDKDIEITLKRGLTPQQWAEKLYRKSKNQIIEKHKLDEKICLLEGELMRLKKELSAVEDINDIKQLKAGLKLNKPAMELLPFRYFKIEGFEIYAGKNSVNNDKLTFGFAHKEDLWLHASGVSGSHVVIKHKQKEIFPISVIHKAAGIAAYYSKSKGSILVPVIYTLKKYVRKPKGAPPGSVMVEKEKMVMAEPKLWLPIKDK